MWEEEGWEGTVALGAVVLGVAVWEAVGTVGTVAAAMADSQEAVMAVAAEEGGTAAAVAATVDMVRKEERVVLREEAATAVVVREEAAMVVAVTAEVQEVAMEEAGVEEGVPVEGETGVAGLVGEEMGGGAMVGDPGEEVRLAADAVEEAQAAQGVEMAGPKAARARPPRLRGQGKRSRHPAIHPAQEQEPGTTCRSQTAYHPRHQRGGRMRTWNYPKVHRECCHQHEQRRRSQRWTRASIERCAPRESPSFRRR